MDKREGSQSDTGETHYGGKLDRNSGMRSAFKIKAERDNYDDKHLNWTNWRNVNRACLF